VIFVLKVRNQKLPVPFILAIANAGKLICFELLVLGRVRIIKGPLLERDIFADKVK